MRRKIAGITPPVSDFGAFSNAVSPLTPMYSSTAPPFPNDRSKITLSFSFYDETPRGEMRTLLLCVLPFCNLFPRTYIRRRLIPHYDSGPLHKHQIYIRPIFHNECSPTTKRKSTNCCASLIRMAHKLYPVHNIDAYQMHIPISADGETGTLIFCVKSSTLLSQHHKNRHMIRVHKINTTSYYSWHENVDSSSTGSTHDTLMLCLKNKISIKRRPNPNTEHQCCNPTSIATLPS